VARRALLLGSATYGLTGIDHDVALMARLLKGRGFDAVTTHTGAEATRDGMLDALNQLVAQTGPGDAVVLYYSGHGSRVSRPDARQRGARGLEAHLQFLLPTDMEQTTESDFRGLIGPELTATTTLLTNATDNVTVILDCCHSGAMVRSIEYVPKTVQPALPLLGAIEIADRLQRDQPGTGLAANPRAVRIVACETDRSAYEVRRPGGHDMRDRGGALTMALVETLQEVGERRVSWHSILTGVRERVQVLVQQRPDVEGPAERVPFSLDALRVREVLPVRRLADRVVVEGAVLLDITPGDALRLVREDDESEVAAATVVSLDGADAVLDVAPDALARGTGIVAIPVHTQVRRTVRVAVPDPLGASLRQELDESPRLAAGNENAFAVVTQTADGLVVSDPTGAPARTTASSADAPGVTSTLALLEQLAAGDRLRNLPSGTGAAALASSVDVVVRRTAPDQPDPAAFAPEDEALHNGDRVSVTVRNSGPEPVHVWLFDVGVSGRITLISNDIPSGRPLAPSGQPGDAHSWGGPQGIEMSWPRDVPADLPRPETFVVLAADRPADLRALETAGQDARSGEDLSGLLAEVREGVREAGGVLRDALRYTAQRVDFLLVPTARPRADEPAFEVDESPDLTTRIAVSRGPAAPPSVLALRLSEMLIRRNRALFGADVRIDWLVVTVGEDGRPVPTLGTERFPRVSDGDMLPLDDMLLFHGRARDYLELRLWVSRDDHKGQDLATLFDGRMSDAGVQSALATVIGFAVVAPQAALAVGAVAAVATLTKVAAELVSKATGKDIGVYRTSLLAQDRFGEGRIPASGRKQAVDVEFALEVVAVT